jgi:hypothetical protein
MAHSGEFGLCGRSDVGACVTVVTATASARVEEANEGPYPPKMAESGYGPNTTFPTSSAHHR